MSNKDTLRRLAKELIKLHCDVHFERFPREKLDMAVQKIEAEGMQSNISPNEILSVAYSEIKEFEKELEKEHPGVPYATALNLNSA